MDIYKELCSILRALTQERKKANNNVEFNKALTDVIISVKKLMRFY